MIGKPTHASGYRKDDAAHVRATCLYVATRLGDLMDDLVIVGGLVPSLIIDQGARAEGVTAHVGTRDLDVGLTLALLEHGRYRTMTERLRSAGFVPDHNADGRKTRQRWRIDGPAPVTVDFLIEPSREGDRGGRLRDIETDFAAVIAPGLHLAFRDRLRVVVDGATPFGEQARRDVWACGPGAFVVLKALAFLGRGENKDAYDLYYVLRNFGAGVEDVAARFAPLVDAAEAGRSLEILAADFGGIDHVGPRRAAEFLAAGTDEAIQAEVVALVARFLDTVGRMTAGRTR